MRGWYQSNATIAREQLGAMVSRGAYSPSYAGGRGYALPLVGGELSDAEIAEAAEAGRAVSFPLTEKRDKMRREWDVNTPLTRPQMIEIMDRTLAFATETEKGLAEMISKVPSHWETYLISGGSQAQLRQAIADAPKFRAIIDRIFSPSGPGVMPPFPPGVLPGFRLWIDKLMSRSETALAAMAGAKHILPNWLRMMDILSGLHAAAIFIIDGIIKLAKGAAKVATALPDIAKVALIGGAVVGGGVLLMLALKGRK